MGQLRHLRGARRDRRHVGPVPVPGDPLRLRHVHARLLVPPLGGREVDRRRRVDPPVHQGHRGGGGDRRADPLPPPHRPAPTGRPPTPAGRSRRSGPTPGRRSSSPAGFLFSCSGYYRYDQGYQPDFPGMDDFAGTDRPPAAVAGGPRLRRQAGGGDRQRRHRRHADPVDGRRRPRTSRCCSARPATSPRCRPRTRWPPSCAGCSPTACVRPGHPLVQGAHHPGLLPAQPPPPRPRQVAAAQGRRAAAPEGLRRRHPLHPPVRPVGPAALRGAQRRPVQGHQGGRRRRW